VPPKPEPSLTGPSRPLGSPDIPQFYLRGEGPKSGIYAPRVYGAARIQFADRKRGLEETRRVAFLATMSPAGRTLDWDSARPAEVMPEHLLKDAPARASYLPLPGAAMQVTTFTRWAKAFDRWVARTQRVELTTKQEPPEAVTIGPKRGGVSVELVAIVWELAEALPEA
jgi:hypothetical protein